MQPTHVKVDCFNSTIDVSFVDDKIVEIRVNTREPENIKIVAENSGTPGIIGPDLEFNLKQMIDTENRIAKAIAYGDDKSPFASIASLASKPKT